MNAVVTELNPPAPPAKKPRTRTGTWVKMADGREVYFPGQRLMMRTSVINAYGILDHVRLDFRNGHIQQFKIPASLAGRFMGFGVEARFAEVAGESVEAVIKGAEELAKKFDSGEWGIERERAATPKVPVLVMALARYKGRTIEQSLAYYKKLSKSQREQLMDSAELKPVIAQVEQEIGKLPKQKLPPTPQQTESLLSQF